MQNTEHLKIDPKPGYAVSQIPTGWFKYVNNVLKFLQVRNGRLIVNGDKWTIECNASEEGAEGAGGISATGTPALYKGIFLRGYKKIGTSWVAMTVQEEISQNPTKLKEEAEADGDTICLQPTWDWVRVKS